MRLRARLGLLCVALTGCRHLPEAATVDVANGVVAVGPCRCKLPPPQEAQPEAGDEQPR